MSGGLMPRWARKARSSRSSGWYPWRGRRWRELRELQTQRAAVEPCWRTSPAGCEQQAAVQSALADWHSPRVLLPGATTITSIEIGPQTFTLPEPYVVQETGWHVVEETTPGEWRIRPAGTS